MFGKTENIHGVYTETEEKNKSGIRREMLQMRRDMCADDVLLKSRAAAKIFLESDIYKNARQIMLYMPLGNEADTSLIIRQAFKDEKQLVFPVTNGETGEITPCIADAKTEFVKGDFSVFEPKNKIPAEIAKIEAIIVPGVAFDKSGARIGFGKGCYDRLLKECKAINVGFCYELQLIEKIPWEPHDVKMDYVITENCIYGCGNIMGEII